MTPGRLLFLIFIVVPIVEIYILIQVGGIIGALPTIFLVVLTAVIGSAMLRHQGLATLRQAQQSVERGEVPATAMIDGVFLIIGGAFLLTPGFFTDAVGFLCLLPAGRAWMVRQAMKKVSIVQQPHPGMGPRTRDPNIIDGEWRRDKE